MKLLTKKSIFFQLLLLVAVTNIASAKWCESNSECGDFRYYKCLDNQCCKKSGLGCGAGYSWPCCNRCVIPKYHFTGTCS
jgi:hypothetical protein